MTSRYTHQIMLNGMLGLELLACDGSGGSATGATAPDSGKKASSSYSTGNSGTGQDSASNARGAANTRSDITSSIDATSAAQGGSGSLGKTSGRGGQAIARTNSTGTGFEDETSTVGGVNSSRISSGGSATGGTRKLSTSVDRTSAGGAPNSSGTFAGGAPSAGGVLGSAATSGSGEGTGTPGCNGNAKPSTSPSKGYLNIDVNGATREYVLELPTSYDGQSPQPVLFAFHGTESNAQEFLGFGYGDVRKGAAGRFILVGPNGLSRNGQTGWVSFSGSPNAIDQVDIDFFDALVAELKAAYCVDSGRIFSMGHSAGAFISNQLGCIRGNVLRGVGPFAGAGPVEGRSASCTNKVAAFIGHNPKEGDASECAKMSEGKCPWVVPWDTMGWPTTQFWFKKNGCGEPGPMPTAAFDGNSTTGNPLPCKLQEGCDSNYPVMLCLYDYSDQWDGPHAFPTQWGAKAVADFFLALPKVQ